MVSLAASRGRRVAFIDEVAAFVHALIDELVILLLPGGLGQGRTAVLHKTLYGTRKASRLWQRFLRDVLADADWKASVILRRCTRLVTREALSVAGATTS